MKAISDRASALDSRPGVAFIEWVDPLMSGGNWVPELIEMAGGLNLFGEAGRHSPWMSWEELVAKDPEIVFVSPCGYDISRSLEDMPLLAAKPEWPDLKAVGSGNVFVADGNQYFNRPGPRLVESLEILAETIHPTDFRFGREGAGWIRFEARSTQG
jgi:iron complex transport system substrate-binding protein